MEFCEDLKVVFYYLAVVGVRCVAMSGRRSRYFDPSAVRTPGFIHRPTSASGRLSLKERHKRKRRRANAVSPLPSSAPPQDEQVTATTCSICLSNVVGPAGLPCNHIFCFGCITKWARETATTCPLCKKVNSVRPLYVNERLFFLLIAWLA